VDAVAGGLAIFPKMIVPGAAASGMVER